MITAKIASISSGEILYQERFEVLDKAIAWLRSQVPKPEIESLTPGHKTDIDGVYRVSLEADPEPLPDVEVNVEVNPEPPFVGDEIPDLNPLNAEDAIAIIHQQTDPEVLTLLAEGERANHNRKTVLTAIEKQIEKLQAK